MISPEQWELWRRQGRQNRSSERRFEDEQREADERMAAVRAKLKMQRLQAAATDEDWAEELARLQAVWAERAAAVEATNVVRRKAWEARERERQAQAAQWQERRKREAEERLAQDEQRRQLAEKVKAERQAEAEARQAKLDAELAERQRHLALRQAEHRAEGRCTYAYPEAGRGLCYGRRGRHPEFCAAHRGPHAQPSREQVVAAQRARRKREREQPLRTCRWSNVARWEAEVASEGVVDPSHEYAVNYRETDSEDAFYREAVEPYYWR